MRDAILRDSEVLTVLGVSPGVASYSDHRPRCRCRQLDGVGSKEAVVSQRTRGRE
jgi:hypothetical protein